MSDRQSENGRLGEILANLPSHSHLCLIYGTLQEQLSAAVPFMRTGLERGERCLYVADKPTSDGVFHAMRAEGIDVDAALQGRALSVADKQEEFLKQGRFDPKWMLQFYEGASHEAKQAGFRALRIIAEMTWVLGGDSGTEQLMVHEARINHFFRDREALAICQYNRTRFAPEVILDVIRTHPIVVYGGTVCENPYHIPPDEFLGQSTPAMEVQRLLKNLCDAERTREALRSSEERFRALFQNVQVGVVVSGPKAEVLMCNRAALDLLGLTEDQLLGKTSCDSGWKAVYEDGSPCPPEEHPIPRAIASRKAVRNVALGVFRPVLKDWVWLLVTAQPELANDGTVVQVVCTFQDITERKRAEEDLREAAAFNEATMKCLGEGLFTIDKEGLVTSMNPAAEELFGWTFAELRGKKMHEVTHHHFRDGRPFPSSECAGFQVLMHGRALKNHEDVFIHKDGTFFDVMYSIAPLRGVSGVITGLVVVFSDITERKRAEEELRVLSGRLLQLQDEERRRIARELHDTTAQDLAALTTGLTVISDSLPRGDPRIRNRVLDALALAEKCARDIRTLSYLLHPPLLDEGGLKPALQELVYGFSRRSGIRVELDLLPELDRLPQEAEMALFRVAQEGLSNIHSHSGSQTARIQLARTPTEVTLEVTDQGVGIPPGSLEGSGGPSARLGVGIRGMRERMRQLGGNLQIISDGRGTTVKAVLPLH